MTGLKASLVGLSTLGISTDNSFSRCTWERKARWGEERTPTWISETSVRLGLCWGSQAHLPELCKPLMRGVVHIRKYG